MRAAALTQLGKLECIEVADPRIRSADDVLLKIEVVGVCGSDIHYFKEGRIGDQVVEYPYRVGHECSATVVAVGPEVSGLEPGDRVAVDPGMACGECDQCRQGRENTCRRMTFLGCPGQTEGCLSEYMVMPEHCCYKIPDNLNLEEAALVEPLSIGIYAVRLSLPLAGKAVGILGCGPIGMSILLPSGVEGARSVFVTDKIPERLKMARKAGAQWVGNPLKEDIVRAILDQEQDGLDVVFECCGQQEALDQALRLLKPGGRLLIVGIPSEERVSFSVDDMRRKEIAIQNVRRQNDCVQAAIDFITSGHAVGFMTTHRFGLDRSQEAFELVRDYRDGVLKAVIFPGR